MQQVSEASYNRTTEAPSKFEPIDSERNFASLGAEL